MEGAAAVEGAGEARAIRCSRGAAAPSQLLGCSKTTGSR